MAAARGHPHNLTIAHRDRDAAVSDLGIALGRRSGPKDARQYLGSYREER